MNQKEIWRPVKDYENLYEVSNLGRVRSVSRIVLRSNGLKQTVNSKLLSLRVSRYFNITLRKNKVKKTYNVHQLVAVAFLGHKPNGHELVVDHIDKNEHNNSVENLRLIPHLENLKRSMNSSFSDKQRKLSKNRKRINGRFAS